MSFMRLLESMHGHFGVLLTVALLHPAILLRKGQPLSRGTKWSVALTSALSCVAFSLGCTIYEPYRAQIKRPLFFDHPSAGLLFETKEHLAFVVLALSLAAGVGAWTAPRHAKEARQAAAMMYATATLLCVLVGGIGTYVASTRGF
ncbi:MAG: hypothetical protein IPK60_24280 [Sandaracinaceae bacterium]|nr:hypothetical protein [Sandaracinaceae bacterium]